MKSVPKKKILVVAGESGGHIFPALGFCQQLEQNYEITFVSTEIKGSGCLVPQDFNPIILRVNKSFIGMLKLIFSTFSVIFKKQPDVVFGFGGYISVPFIILGRLTGVNTLIHEQNVVPGRANKFLSLFASKIVTSFQETSRYFKNSKKVFCAGYPLRRGLERIDKASALRFFGLKDGFFTVLVMGGSQGAHRINEKFTEALRSNVNLKRLQILHLCGRADCENVRKAYKAMGVESKVFDFLKDMNYAYSAADLVVSRSGAGSLFEIASFGLPSILIPYPFAGAHQVENAKVLAKRGASIMLEDSKMSPEMINGLLDIFSDDAIRRKAMSTIAYSFYESQRNLQIKYIMEAR